MHGGTLDQNTALRCHQQAYRGWMGHPLSRLCAEISYRGDLSPPWYVHIFHSPPDETLTTHIVVAIMFPETGNWGVGNEKYV
jgi:hypothetical protein